MLVRVCCWQKFLSLCPKLCLAFLSKEIFTPDPRVQAPASSPLRACSLGRCCAARLGAFRRSRRPDRGAGASAAAAGAGAWPGGESCSGLPSCESVSLCLLLVGGSQALLLLAFRLLRLRFISFSWASLVRVCFPV